MEQPAAVAAAMHDSFRRKLPVQRRQLVDEMVNK